MPYFYGFDWTYLYIVLPCFLLSLWASSSVNSTFKRYSKQLSSRGITGRDAAICVLESHGITNVRVERVAGKLTDHFDPKTNVIRLSDNVYDSTSTAAIGVACHEAGHAVQYATEYFPMKVRAAIIPATNIGSRLAMPLILLGVLFGIGGSYSYTLVYAGIACFSLSLVFQLVTLPVEFNASRRAMQAIANRGILTPQEQKGARKTLTAAAMTYVAAVAVAAAQLLRLILLFGGRRRND
ncbi:MAG: zinc metallopeptidase [Oscillospiraceae bacterium]|nr:zinc metallopeptidase [Oscillospiraceae bacterium]